MFLQQAYIRDIRSIAHHITYTHIDRCSSTSHKLDVREKRRVLPDIKCAKGEDIGNKGDEARTLRERSTMPVQLYEPVADDTFLGCVAVGESVDGHEVMEEEREESSVAAQFPDGCEGPDVVTRLLELACLDPLHQVLDVERSHATYFWPCDVNQRIDQSYTHTHSFARGFLVGGCVGG